MLVVHGLVEGQPERVLADDAPANVAQTDAAEGARTLAENQAVAGVDDLRDFQRQCGVGKHLAAIAVVQARTVDVQIQLAGQCAGAVVDLLDVDGQSLERTDQTVLMAIEGFAGQQQIAFGDQFAVFLIEGVDVGVDITLGGNPSAIVGHGFGFEAQQTGRSQQAAIAVIECVAVEAQRRLAFEAALVAVVQVVDQQFGGLVGANRPAAVVGVGAADGQGVEAGNLAGAVIQARGLHVHGAVGLDQALVLVVQLLADPRGQRAFAGQLALLAVVELLGFYQQGLFGADLAGAVVDRADRIDIEQTASAHQAGNVIQ
ncbi:hypothetical protein D3C72_331750 [compost metagenome]